MPALLNLCCCLHDRNIVELSAVPAGAQTEHAMRMSFIPNGSEFLAVQRNADPVPLKCHGKSHPSVGCPSKSALCERARRLLIFGREQRPLSAGGNSKNISTR